jgi:hypothetical protein
MFPCRLILELRIETAGIEYPDRIQCPFQALVEVKEHRLQGLKNLTIPVPAAKQRDVPAQRLGLVAQRRHIPLARQPTLSAAPIDKPG